MLTLHNPAQPTIRILIDLVLQLVRVSTTHTSHDTIGSEDPKSSKLTSSLGGIAGLIPADNNTLLGGDRLQLQDCVGALPLVSCLHVLQHDTLVPIVEADCIEVTKLLLIQASLCLDIPKRTGSREITIAKERLKSFKSISVSELGGLSLPVAEGDPVEDVI